MKQAIAWTIAGSDSCGGAGMQADLKTMHNLGVHGCSVITAVTSQNLHAIAHTCYLDADVIRQQIHALHVSMHPRAIKIGMLGNADAISVVGEYLQKYNGFVVLDPLLVSSSGINLHADHFELYLTNLKSLFRHIDLITPNIDEAEKILARQLNDAAAIEMAARDILAMGVKNVVIKGGHDQGSFSQDYWTNGAESCWLANIRQQQRHCHGTGCVLSAAIAAGVALGYEIKDALVIAKMYVNRGIRHACADEHSALFAHQLGWPEEQHDMPYLSQQPFVSLPEPFKHDDLFRQGLYPVVDNADWLQTLLPLGIKLIQLRIKDKSGHELENEIKRAVLLARQYDAKLFINDYWQLAMRYGAYGVHLGQEDLNDADIDAIRAAGLRLGISTHSYYEVARAHACHPSYIACGPIYPTTSKIMAFAPQGIAALARWRRTLDYPLVAIGGINHTNIDEVIGSNVDGIAMISVITAAKDPVNATLQLQDKVSVYAA